MIFESAGRVFSNLSANWEATPGQALSVLITHNGVTYDYAKALTGDAPKKVQRLQRITTLDFSVAALEVFELPIPVRGDYVVFMTAEYGQWFSGYISAEPSQSISGVDVLGDKRWQYDIQVNSDEWLLSLQAVPVGLVYQNTTAGAILADLAERILPGVFSYENIQAGPVVAKYVVDPTRIYEDIVKDLAGNAFYNFYSQGKRLFFFPIDQTEQTVIIDGDDPSFTPATLQITPSTDPIINDVTVVGMVEPQGKITEYFVGDGITGKFNLISGVYGVAEETLLDETFSNDTIDTSIWTIFDSPLGFLQVSNGYLNCLGGYADSSYGVQLISNDLFPLENNLRITHGQWDFVGPSTGILGGLYFDLPQAPAEDGSFPNLLFGVQARKDLFSQNTILSPVTNGVVDTSQYLTVTDYFNTRVTCRTVMHFTNPNRTFYEYGYITQDGTVGSNTSPLAPDTVTISTFLALIDINTGAILREVNWSNTGTVTAEQLYAYYAPIVSDNLNMTVTGITLSRPIQAALFTKSLKFPTYTLHAPGGDINFTSDRGFFMGQTLQPTDDFTLSARLDSLTNINTGGQRAGLMFRYHWDVTPDVNGQTFADDAMVCILISAAGVVSMRHRSSLNGSVEEVGTLDQNQGQTDGITLPQYFQLAKKGSTFTGSYSSDGEAWTPLATVTYTPSTTSGPMVAGCVATGENYNTVEQVVAVFQEVKFNSKPIVVDTTASMGSVLVPFWPRGYMTDTTNWTSESLGVNELDTLDGLAPIATIIEQTQSVQKNANLRGSFQYNPGQCQLDYFSDSTTNTLDVPDIGDLVRLTYNRAGTAIARIVNQQSVNAEAASFGDGGHRKTTIINLSPLPRTSDECSAAAAATINSSGYQHFDGTYTQYNGFGMTGEPQAGALLPFVNLGADIPGLMAEIIQQVTTTLLSVTPKEHYQHQIQFGKINFAEEYVSRLSIPEGAPMPNDIADVPKKVDLDVYDSAVLQPIGKAELISWDRNNWTWQVDDTLNVGEGIEVRSTDEAWGGDPSRNLVYRGTTPLTFTTPRNINGRLVFIRRYDLRNFVPYSEDLTKWTPINATVTNSKQINPDGDVSLVSSIAADEGATLTANLSLPLQVTTQTATARATTITSGGRIQFTPVPLSYKTPVTATTSAASVMCWLNGPMGTEVQIDLIPTFPTGWGVDTYGQEPWGSAPDTSRMNPSTAITLGAGWQHFEWDGLVIPAGATGVVLQFTFLSAGTVSITRVQVEPRETISMYCKTNGGPYGALSRYSYGVRAGLPLIPPKPSGSVDVSDPLNPVITLTLPADESQVWGYEVRDQDNTTVLMTSQYGQSNFGAGYDTTYTYANNTTRNRTFYLYTFNLLGEYSDPFILTMAIASPTISDIAFDDNTLGVSWATDKATSFEVIVQLINETIRPPGLNSPLTAAGQSNFTFTTIGDLPVSGQKTPGLATEVITTKAQKVSLTSADYFNERFITIVPYDNLGAGTGVMIDHVYAPPVVDEFNLNEILVVPPPAGIAQLPTPPTGPVGGTDPIKIIYYKESLDNYQRNLKITPQTGS